MCNHGINLNRNTMFSEKFSEKHCIVARIGQIIEIGSFIREILCSYGMSLNNRNTFCVVAYRVDYRNRKFRRETFAVMI